MVFASAGVSAQDIQGYWKTINDKTHKPESVIGIYEYQGKYFGKLVATYDDNEKIDDTIDAPKYKAPGVVGDPYYVGLDIIYDIKKDGSKFDGGKIVDPEKGDVYDAELWLDKGNLIVRGEILFFGENETWLPMKDTDFPANFKKPDLSKFVPSIPKVKE